MGFDGVPWCSEYLCWCCNASGAPELVALPGRPKGSAYSGDIFDKYLSAGRVSMTPRAGDFVVFDWPRAGTNSDHIGIVEAIDRAGVHTIEGNSPGPRPALRLGRTPSPPADALRARLLPSGVLGRGACSHDRSQPADPPTGGEEEPMYLAKAIGDKTGAIYLVWGNTRRWIQDVDELNHWLIVVPDHKVQDWPFTHLARIPFTPDSAHP